MRAKRLIKKSGLYLIGNLSSKIMSALFLPIYAFYIQTNDLGYFDYTQTIMGILIPIMFVAIWEAILRFLLFETDQIKRITLITTSMSFIILILSVLIMGIIIYATLISPGIRSIALIGTMFIVYSIVQIWQYYARALEKSKLYIYSGIIGTIINFIFVILFICGFKFELNGLFIAYILGQLSIFVVIESNIHIINSIKLRYFDFATLKKMLLFSAPLVLNITSAWLFTGFGRILITSKLGTEANGIYAFASKFSVIFYMLGSVVTMAVIEEAIIAAKTKGFNSEFTKTIEDVFKIFMSLALITVPLIAIFYSFILKTDYYDSFSYAPWLLIYAVISTMASNVGAVFQAINKTKYQFITTIIGAVVTMCVSYALISIFNVYAVIIGQALGAFAMLLSRYLLANRFVYFKINWKPIWGMGLLFLGVTIISLKMQLVINSLMLLVIISVLCYMNRILIFNGYKLLETKLGKL